MQKYKHYLKIQNLHYIVISKGGGLKVNVEECKYILMTDHWKAQQAHNVMKYKRMCKNLLVFCY